MDENAFTYAAPTDPLLKRLAIDLVERATGRERLKQLYFRQQANGWSGASFFETAIAALSLDLRYDEARLAALPKSGPLVVVANHPFGVLDGIVICALMEKVRTDYLVLTNAVLLRAPEMRARMLPIDFAETREAQRTNVASRNQAVNHIAAGGCVVIFPGSGVSTSPDRLGRRPAVDPPWTPFLARLVQRAKAPVAPVFFHGQNSRLFQMVSHVSLTLRLSLFFHEVRRRIGTPFPVEIGETIPYEELAAIASRRHLVDTLRQRTYALATQPRPR